MRLAMVLVKTDNRRLSLFQSSQTPQKGNMRSTRQTLLARFLVARPPFSAAFFLHFTITIYKIKLNQAALQIAAILTNLEITMAELAF
jgi:hypothetical protein